MQFSDAIWWRHNKSKMADGRHIENRFLVISRRHIGRSTRNLEQKWRITCRYRSRVQNCNFRKFKMADGRHFENSFISISQPRISDFDQIWYTDTNFHSEHANLKKKSKYFKFKMADEGYIDNRFLALSRRLIGRLMRNSEWRWRITIGRVAKRQFLQIQDGGRPPFWK